jgi:hypothetical protein
MYKFNGISTSAPVTGLQKYKEKQDIQGARNPGKSGIPLYQNEPY